MNLSIVLYVVKIITAVMLKISHSMSAGVVKRTSQKRFLIYSQPINYEKHASVKIVWRNLLHVVKLKTIPFIQKCEVAERFLTQLRISFIFFQRVFQLRLKREK